MDVLVTYATKHGSTKQVAEAVAGALRDRGARVELRECRSRNPVTARDLVVVGGALYSGRWHHHARRFLARNRRALAGVPVAVFGMGPRDDTEQAWRRSWAQLDREISKYAWLSPVAVTVFGGVDPPKHAAPHRDLRDWDRIRAWSEEIMTTTGQRHDQLAD